MNTMTQSQNFAHFNGVLKTLVDGIAQMFNEQNNGGVDFEDVRTIISHPGKAAVGMAVASHADRARIAAEQAVASFLFEGVNLTEAKALLVLIVASQCSLRLAECRLVQKTIRHHAAQDAHIVLSCVYDETLSDSLSVIVVATGLGA